MHAMPRTAPTALSLDVDVILPGDCIEVMRTLPAESLDLIKRWFSRLTD